MKTYLKLFAGAAFLLSACSTGSKVTSGGYDDVYFTPGDNPPPVVSNSSTYNRPEQQQYPSVTSEKSQEKAASIVDEYFDQNQADNKDDYLNNQNSVNAPDTLYEGEDENLSADAEDEDLGDLSYSTRLRTFYDPYLYDPYWDSYLGWNSGWSIGFGAGWYGGWYGGYNPWYTGWYDPWYYSWGYYPYYSYPYYGYYGGFGGGHWDRWHGTHGDRYYGDRYFGRQNQAGRLGRSSNAVAYGSGAVVRSGALGGSYPRSSSNAITYRRGMNNSAYSTSTRQAGTRYTVNPNLSARSARMSAPQRQGGRSNETLMNLRRSQSTRQEMSSPRSYTPNNEQRYTPTYSRPRTNTRATYNSGARDFNRESFNRSSGTTRYSKPNSYSSAPSRSEFGNSSNYQRRSATIGSQRSSGSYSAPRFSAPSRSSYSGGGGSYSAPSRSFGGGGGSFSGGGGSYSGGSSGSFSGGGGGGGGRRR